MTEDFYIRQVRRSSTGAVVSDEPRKIGPFDSRDAAEAHLADIDTEESFYEFEVVSASRARRLASTPT